MFEDISEKLKRFKMPEESLIKKIERIKKTPDAGISSASVSNPSSVSAGSPPNAPDISEQVKKAQEEMTHKIEEIVKSKTEQINQSVEAIKEFDVKINKLEGAVSNTKSSVGEFKDRLDKIDESLLELLSLYEVVSSTVNPFVGEKGIIPNEKLDQMEKRIDILSQKPSGIPANIKEEYDIKFKALEGSLEELTQLIDSAPPNQEDMIRNVSEQVMERIKPLIEQMKPMIEQHLQQTASQTSSGTPGSADTTATRYPDENIKLQYLDNKAETSIILLNWIEFLLEKVGRNNLSEVLEYYIDIGWISEDVCEKMLAYANGIDYYVERPTWKLLPDDHTKSLMFIEQLKGRKLEKSMLSKLERDVEKVIRTNEIYVS
ncbi:MAG TPA: FlaD/FlaE family flagellar protein [Candidatus Methanoperedens sp.]|nr:FlaD/FlaE family flagellar protein [Candidatus Methanoperedens sp.]